VKPAQRSPRLERRRGDRAMTTKRRRLRGSVVVALELGEEGRRAGTGAAMTGRGPRPIIGAGGRQRRLGGFNGRP
jgi:hypothetical protein